MTRGEINAKWPGLLHALENDFTPSKPIAYYQDPEIGYDAVNLFLIEYRDDKAYGLCIWNHDAEEFVEEPGELDDYGMKSLAEVYGKYPALKHNKVNMVDIPGGFKSVMVELTPAEISILQDFIQDTKENHEDDMEEDEDEDYLPLYGNKHKLSDIGGLEQKLDKAAEETIIKTKKHGTIR